MANMPRGIKTAALWRNPAYRARMTKARGNGSRNKGRHWKQINPRKKGLISNFRGKRHTVAAREKNADAHRGKKPWNWIADRTKLKKSDRILNDPARQEWTRNVKNRDRWRCRLSDENCRGRIEAHHIVPWSESPGQRYKINNGISLCHAHHPRKSDDVKKLTPIFQELVKARVQ